MTATLLLLVGSCVTLSATVIFLIVLIVQAVGATAPTRSTKRYEKLVARCAVLDAECCRLRAEIIAVRADTTCITGRLAKRSAYR